MNFYKSNNFVDYEWDVDDDIIMTIDLSKYFEKEETPETTSRN